ncbi:MAG TPA: SDR family oxidoreductase [Ktedonobacterales bacterium]|nr:SDR family oxidoreductase [Ktedonobacterales bacterium]
MSEESTPHRHPYAPLASRIAVVTGGGRGIGRAIALTLASRGARVIIGYHTSATAAEETMREAQSLYAQAYADPADRDEPGAIAWQVDVTKPAEIAVLAAQATALGGPHIWVNNAGASANRSETASLSDEERWDRAMQVDLKGTWLCCLAVAPLMREARGGVIINIGWAQALDGALGVSGVAGQIYAASKAGILALTRVFAQQWAPDVRVNAVAPGWVENDWSATRAPAFRERIAQRLPLQRWGVPLDIAEAVAYLASPAASYITGQTLIVDGGAVMR